MMKIPPALGRENAAVKEIEARDTGGKVVIVDVGKGKGMGV